jgi:hypothetical protein
MSKYRIYPYQLFCILKGYFGTLIYKDMLWIRITVYMITDFKELHYIQRTLIVFSKTTQNKSTSKGQVELLIQNTNICPFR